MDTATEAQFDTWDLALGRFQLLRLKLVWEALSDATLPGFKGSMLRGGLGHALKGGLCAELPAVCDNCRRPEACSYSYLFETNVRNYLGSGQEDVPHPFVIRPPGELTRGYRQGDRLACELILIGEGCRYLPYFLRAFQQAGENGFGTARGAFRLRSAQALRPGAPPACVLESRSGTFTAPWPLVNGAQVLEPWLYLGARRAVIRFLTPARLKSKGRYVADVSFETLVRRLLRRTALLSFFHHGIELRMDFKEVVAKAAQVRTIESRLRWMDWERESSRQSTRLKMGGVVGEVTYEGEDLSSFFPLLALGEWVHVGKGTSLGLGRFKVVRTR